MANLTSPVEHNQAANNSINYFNEVPEDILYCIFSALILSKKDLHSLLLTDKRFNRFFSNHNPLIEKIVASLFPQSYKSNPNCSNWKEFYTQLVNVEKNFQAKQFRMQTLEPKKGKIPTWVHLQKNKIIPLTKGDYQHALYEDKFYTYYSLGGIEVCNANNGKILHKLRAHVLGINAILIHDGKLFSCTDDGTAKAWTLDHLNMEKNLLEFPNNGNVLCVTQQDNTLYFGQTQGSVLIYDLKNKSSSSFPCFENRTIGRCSVFSLAVQGNTLCAGSRDGFIKVFDLNSKKEVHFLNLNNNWMNNITCLLLHDNRLFAGDSDGKIRVFDINNGKILLNIYDRFESIQCLAMQNHKLYSCPRATSSDKNINVLDFSYPSLSSYSTQILEEDLSILGKIAQAQNTKSYEEREALVKTLHPNVQKRLKQHAFKLDHSFTLTEEVILRVQTEIYLELLLDRIHGEDQKRVSEILNQLIKIGCRINWLYEFLSLGCDMKGYDYGEKAFHGDPNSPASVQQKESAVLSYKQSLKTGWGEDLPLLLVDFGVVSKEEYSQKLDCTPDVLEKVGILSQDDLDALGVLIIPVAHLTKEQVESNQATQTQDYEKRTRVCEALQKVSDEIEKRYRESENYSATLFTDEKGSPIAQELNPWAVFKKQFEENKALLEAKCQIPSELSKNYTKIIEEANALIDKFNIFDREYQITKLRTYIHQVGIRPKWSALNEQETVSLAEFAKKNPSLNLFKMGD